MLINFFCTNSFEVKLVAEFDYPYKRELTDNEKLRIFPHELFKAYSFL